MILSCADQKPLEGSGFFALENDMILEITGKFIIRQQIYGAKA